MAMRSLLKFTNLPRNHVRRNYCSSKKLVDTQINNGVAIVTMQRTPVNALNYELLSELATTLDDLEDQKIKGMILSSSLNTIYSGGLDIFELIKPDQERFTKFWSALQDTWMKLFGASYPTVAAINGHAPAGGCLLAMSCEYRVMVNNFMIGLNEAQLGIVAPLWLMNTMKNTISVREAELALTSGRLFNTDEALKVGLIDEIANDKADAMAKSQKFLERFAKIHPLARRLTKLSLRQPLIEELMENPEEDMNKFKSHVDREEIQQTLSKYLEALKTKRK